MLRLRKLWLNIHLWIGVALFLALIPLGVTGALLVWDQPIDRALHASRFAVAKAKPELSPSAYADAATTAFAGRAKVASLRLPAEAGVPVTVVGQIPGAPGANGRPRQLTAWVDPASAKVTDVAEVQKSAFSIMHRLHGSLLIPNIGRKVVGWLGWAMTLSSVTGLILWWPRNGAFLKGLRWKRTPMTMDNLHHTVGFWLCVPLFVLSLTGVYISFPQTARAMFGLAPPPGQQTGGLPRARTSPPPLDQTALTVDEAVGAARTEAEGRVTAISFPTKGKDPTWRIEIKPDGGKAQALRVSDATREVKADRAGPGGRGNQDSLSRLMRQVHDGADTGPVWQIIIVLAGLAPAVLGITGVVMWARRQLRKAALRGG